MADPQRYQSPLTGPEMDQALLDMANHTSERFAKGTANGVAVEAGTDGYNDNSKFYKDQAANQVTLAAAQVTQANNAADRAANAADRAEAAVPAGIDSAVLFTRAQTLTAAQKSQARANIAAYALVLTSSSFSSLPQTITNSNITDKHVVVNSVLSNPSAQTGNWTVTTSNGSLTISGNISGTTTITLYLMPNG